MSGIYGVVSRNKIQVNDYKGLAIWNNNYGDLEAQSYGDESSFIGIKPEQLKEQQLGTVVFSEENTIGVCDALIYSEKNTSDSDELFLYRRVLQGGGSAVKDVNGDFAGALWNKEKKELTLFRDHMGIRPLFYYMDDGRVIFSTDIRGILSVEDVDTAVNERWLYADLTATSKITPTNTEYDKIFCVPFGGFLTFSFAGNKVTKTEGRYFVPGSKKIRMKNREAYTKELRRLIEDAVKIRANATNLKVGAELSGGLDSGVISLLLSQIKKDSYYFSWSATEDELELAERDERLIIKDICDKAGITCNHMKLTTGYEELPYMKDRFPLKDNDNYKDSGFAVEFACPAYLNTVPVYETASFMKSNGVKFIFSGHGGDEGVSHRGNPYEMFYFHEYYHYLRVMYSRSSKDKHRIKKTIELIRKNQQIANDDMKKPYMAELGGIDAINQEFYKKYSDKPAKPLTFFFDPINYVRRGGSRNRLDVLSFFSSCAGVRYFTPFCDYRLIEFALGIPRWLYFNWYQSRFIYREAFKDIMPASMYNNSLKRDMSINSAPQVDPEEEQKARMSQTRVEKRRKMVDMLDKKMWSSYLDFDKLEKWVTGNCSETDDRLNNAAVYECERLEHTVKRAREVHKLS